MSHQPTDCQAERYRRNRAILGNDTATCKRSGRRPLTLSSEVWRALLPKPVLNLTDRIHNWFRCHAAAKTPPRHFAHRKAYSKSQIPSTIAIDASAALSATIYRFVSEPKQAKRYFVSGNVQGVGFRFFTLRAAERMNLTGYARNLPDGRVEAYAVGTPDQLAKLQSALERGPWGASVTEVKEEHAAIDPEYESGFVIIY